MERKKKADSRSISHFDFMEEEKNLTMFECCCWKYGNLRAQMLVFTFSFHETSGYYFMNKTQRTPKLNTTFPHIDTPGERETHSYGLRLWSKKTREPFNLFHQTDAAAFKCKNHLVYIGFTRNEI